MGQSGRGVYKQKVDAGECMVVGCTKRAIYRNATSVRNSGVVRGYCRLHRDKAVTRLSTSCSESEVDWLANDDLSRRER